MKAKQPPSGRNVMNLLLKIFVLSWLALITSQPAWALGTTAGTSITNTATASYTVGVTPLTATSNTTTYTVDELLDVTVVGQDAGSQVTVSSGDAAQVLTFQITNTGNGTDDYSLTAANLVGDVFNATGLAIYQDDGNGVFNAILDTLLDGSNDPVLAADAAITVFVVGDIPLGLGNGDDADLQLTIDSNTATGLPGTAIGGAGDGGSDAVIGSSGGTDSTVESYVVSSVIVTLFKSFNIADPFGGIAPVPGATITYSIVVTVTGAGTATGVVISDPVPANTTYPGNSLALDAIPLTDAADADAGDVGATTPGTVTVNLGDLTAGSQTITFDVTIN